MDYTQQKYTKIYKYLHLTDIIQYFHVNSSKYLALKGGGRGGFPPSLNKISVNVNVNVNVNVIVTVIMIMNVNIRIIK
jgi:hypothetical protein